MAGKLAIGAGQWGCKMRTVAALFWSVLVCGLLAIRMAFAADGPPAWAYPMNNPDYKPPVDDGKPVRVPLGWIHLEPVA